MLESSSSSPALGDSSATAVAETKSPLPSSLLFDVVREALLVAVTLTKDRGSVGLVLKDTRHDEGRREANITVKSVAAGSPAERSGLQPGDKVREFTPRSQP